MRPTPIVGVLAVPMRGNGLLIRGNGLVPLPFLPELEPQVVKGNPVVRPEADGLPACSDGLIQLSLVQERDSQVPVGCGTLLADRVGGHRVARRFAALY